MDVAGVVATAVWAVLPAYLPNSAAVLGGGGRPLDGGRTVGGTRLLGDGKTWRGTATGWAAGAALAVALNAVNASVADLVGVSLPSFPPAAIIALPLGAMGGDIAASFLKRRINRAQGSPVPGVDQFDFLVGALVLTLGAAPTWSFETFTPPVLVVILVVTPAVHLAANRIAYVLGLKDIPW
jgi:CDP-2,3-bis-(O-geranylgeranyl)-sn-glycerol synthase